MEPRAATRRVDDATALAVRVSSDDLRSTAATSEVLRATAGRALEWGSGMPTTVLGGAFAAGAPSTDAVLAEHVAVQPGEQVCRACGHVYSDELPVCPAVLAAQAGYPGVADRMRMVQPSDQVSPLQALQLAHERLEARVDALAAAPERGARRQRVRGRRAGFLRAAWMLPSRS